MATAPLAAALIGVFIGALDLTVIATILPSMVMDLDVNTADVDRYVWIVNGYLLAYIVAIPLMGRISDIIGRRPAFLIALTVFVVGSAWCASAESLSSLIAARVVQGAGGGAVLPVTMALVGDLAAPAKRVAALGVVGAVDTLGWVVGPIWGAAIVGILGGDKDSWRWVFWINLPLGVLAASAIMIGIAPRPTSKSQSLDVVGALLLAIALVALNLALSSGGELSGDEGSGLRALGGTRNPLVDHLVELLLLTVVAAGLFMLWERRNSAPLVPLALFRHRPFVIAMATNFLVGAALIIAMVDVPIVIALLVAPERVSSLSALMLAPFTLLMALLSLGGGIFAARVGIRNAAVLGLVLVVVGYLGLFAGLQSGDYIRMVPGLLIAGAGFGLVIAPIASIAIGAAAIGDRGIAAGLTLVFRLLGMTVGISTLTSVAIRRLQSLTGNLQPITQGTEESTAAFLDRQRQFLETNVIPLSLQVVRETFLIAGGIALLGLIPAFQLRKSGTKEEAIDE